MQQVQVIECSNKKSDSYDKSLSNIRSNKHSSWDNLVDLDLNPGDQVIVDSSILNLGV